MPLACAGDCAAGRRWGSRRPSWASLSFPTVLAPRATFRDRASAFPALTCLTPWPLQGPCWSFPAGPGLLLCSCSRSLRWKASVRSGDFFASQRESLSLSTSLPCWPRWLWYLAQSVVEMLVRAQSIAPRAFAPLYATATAAFGITLRLQAFCRPRHRNCIGAGPAFLRCCFCCRSSILRPPASPPLPCDHHHVPPMCACAVMTARCGPLQGFWGQAIPRPF